MAGDLGTGTPCTKLSAFTWTAMGAPSKLVLGLPELKICNSGENIAAQIMEVLEIYEILEKVGYITLDNAANMNTAAEGIADALGFDPPKKTSTVPRPHRELGGNSAVV